MKKGFNPLHRGMGVLTFAGGWDITPFGVFQSSTSRHGGTDIISAVFTCATVWRFNPLHRGMGVLTPWNPAWGREMNFVSILYIEAWGY